MRASYAFLLTAAGCAQVLDVDGYTTVESLRTLEGCGERPYRDEECGACLTQHCCQKATDCAADEACSRLDACFARCTAGDTTCANTCMGATPYVSPALASLTQCRLSACADACAAPQACGLVAPAYADCVRANADCCGQWSAIWRDEQMVPVLACAGECAIDPPLCGCVQPGSAEAARLASAFKCASCGEPAPNDISCVGSVQWPSINTGALDLHVRIREYASGNTPVPRVEVTPCSEAAATCIPLAPLQRSNATGDVVFRLEGRAPGSRDYLGFLQLHGDDATTPDTIYYLFPAPRQTGARIAYLVSRVVLDSLYATVGVVQDPARGTIAMQVLDCRGAYAAGVRLTIDVSGQVAYGGDQRWTTNASGTDSSGAAAFGNVMPGLVTVRATHIASGRLMSELSVHVRAGMITTFAMPPSELRPVF